MKQIFCVALALASFELAPAWAQTPPAPASDDASIAAIVNGEVITNQDVINRARLVAVSTGMVPTPAVLARLEPQVTTVLIDQTLQQQEINHLNVTVAEADIAGAVSHIEQNNNMASGALRAHLAADGIPFSTLVAQLRTQLGWQTVLHQVLGAGLQPTPGDMNAEKAALKAEIGSTQYHLGEIFIPVTDPANDAPAQSFANTVIAQLRTGAPFPIIAAQFSQAQTALSGGDLGFVQLSQLDPAVASVVASMPVGAISNPIRVPGGYDIIQLQAMHLIGTAQQTMLTIAQAFAPFPVPISNGTVGPVQAAVINKLAQTTKSAHSCADITADNAALGNIRPANPGPVNLATVTPPAFQSLLAALTPGQVSKPLVEQSGVSVIMLCARQSEAASLPSDDQIANIIVERRVELESNQLLDILRHRAVITQN
jgi:peptidyl-prolyl cis-trans isomerase SurA